MEINRLRQADIEHGDRASTILNVIEKRLQEEMIPSVARCDIFNIARNIDASATDIQDVVQHIDNIKCESEHTDLKRHKGRLNQLADKHHQLLRSINDKCICMMR